MQVQSLAMMHVAFCARERSALWPNGLSEHAFLTRSFLFGAVGKKEEEEEEEKEEEEDGTPTPPLSLLQAPLSIQ